MPSKPGTHCSATCPTRDHATFGECIRNKGLRVAPNLADTGASKAWDGEIQAYKDARAQGIQPAGTKMHQIREAVEASNAVGKAYDATTRTFGDAV